MRIVKILSVAAALALVVGCSCRTRSVEPAGVEVGGGVDGPLKDVHFGFDSFALDSGAKATLSSNAEWLKSNSSARAQVEGHCDERGTNEYNMALGANRAKSAADYLRSLGVDASRLSTVSYGEELPVDPAHDESAWAKNRRAHFNVQR